MLLQIELNDEQLTKIADMVAVKMRLGKADTYSVQEAANKLGIHKSTVTNRIRAGIIPKIPKIGRTRIPAAFIDKLVNPQLD